LKIKGQKLKAENQYDSKKIFRFAI